MEYTIEQLMEYTIEQLVSKKYNVIELSPNHSAILIITDTRDGRWGAKFNDFATTITNLRNVADKIEEWHKDETDRMA